MADGCHHNTVVVPTQADTLLTSPFDCKFVKDAVESSGVFTWHKPFVAPGNNNVLCFRSMHLHSAYPQGLIFCFQPLNESLIHKKTTRKSFHTPSPIKGCSSHLLSSGHQDKWTSLSHGFFMTVRLSWPSWWGSDTYAQTGTSWVYQAPAHKSAWLASWVARTIKISRRKAHFLLSCLE